MNHSLPLFEFNKIRTNPELNSGFVRIIVYFKYDKT